MESHFKTFHRDESQRKSWTSILTDADVLEDVNGETYILVEPYNECMLRSLEELASSTIKHQSLDNLMKYESFSRRLLHEWTIIIGNLTIHLAAEHKCESSDSSIKTLEGLIDNMRAMFEHLVKANKLLMQFGRVPGDSSTGEQS